MKRKLNSFFLIALSIISVYDLIAQAVPPNSILVNINESLGAGCHDTTDNIGGKMCFDVNIKVDKPGWRLQSYNIWMNYGPDNNVLSYDSDKSCKHADGGDIDLNAEGLYRFLAGNFGLNLELNEWTNFHNFCLDVVQFSGLKSTSVVPGGNYYGMVSSVNIVDQNNSSNAINPQVDLGNTFSMNESSFLTIDPMGVVNCEYPYLELFAMPLDATGSAVLDCEPFIFLWLGPNGFQSQEPDTVIFIDDSIAQSGTYELHVVGADGCYGYEAFVVDLQTCASNVCHDNINIEGPVSIVNSKKARFEITSQDAVVVMDSLAFSAPSISLMPHFEVPMGSAFETIMTGCP